MAVSKFTSASGGNDFNINVGSTYSVTNFTQEYAAGSYSFTSAQLDTTMDVYAYNSLGTLVGYTNGKGLTCSAGFIKLVILGGTVGDVLSFSYKTTYYANAETNEILAGPVILSTTPTSLPNVNSSTTVTGLNFATDVAVTFTGTDNLVRNAKSVVRGSANSLVVTRPDAMPVAYNPYSMTATNQSVAYQPTGSSSNILTGINAGNLPTWVTTGSQSSTAGFPISVSAVDSSDTGSSIAYSFISGSFPTGTTSVNSTTGYLNGVPTTPGTYTFTIRATDSGGNTADRTFVWTITGANVTSDATYYYIAVTGNTTLNIPSNITADIVAVGGGGASTQYAGGGGGAEVIYMPGKTLTANSYPIVIGSGGTGSTGQFNTGMNGNSTTCFGETIKPGGGAKNPDDFTNPVDTGQIYTAVANGGGGSSRSGGYFGSLGTSVGTGITRYGGNRGGQTQSGGSSSNQSPNYPGGGGGGAGASVTGDTGGTTSNNSAGNGGAGVQLLGLYWGGGGGGGIYYNSPSTTPGSGGLGGGGGAGNSSPGSGGGSAYTSGSAGSSSTPFSGGNGGANTGGGAGAGRGETGGTGGNGGSGMVYIRYTRASVGG